MSGRKSDPQRCVWIGLGGNMGHVKTAMAGVLQALDERNDTSVKAVSGLYRTAPWGKTDQPDFLNCCAVLETGLAARELLSVCLGLEQAWHRVRGERWGPRTIDIDIIAHEAEPIRDVDLVVPHPRAHERAFVLLPLSEIAPDLQLGHGLVSELAKHIDSSGVWRLEQPENWWRNEISRPE